MTEISLALFQPDIPQNTGTILRLAACFGTKVHVIGPTGFDMTNKSLRRAGLDYLDHVDIIRHEDWAAFASAIAVAQAGSYWHQPIRHNAMTNSNIISMT